MEKLELKHLAPYLPYGLKYCRVSKSPVTLKEEIKIMGEVSTKGNIHNINNNMLSYYDNTKYLPILRPLSDLTKVIQWEDGEYCMTDIDDFNLDELDFNTVQDYISRHFDVFGLIDKGLAISYSDVQSMSNEG